VTTFPVRLVGDGMLVPCVDGNERPYVALDTAASTGALEPVLRRVNEFLPVYSAVHRGSGYKSQLSTDAYEDARQAALGFAGREGRDDVAVICRNTTEALNHLAYSLRLCPTTSWSPPSRSTTPTSCRGPAWRRAATSSASPTGPSPQPMSWPNWTGPPSRDCSPSPLPQISPGGYADRRDHRCLSQPGDPSRRGCRPAGASPATTPNGRFHRLERTQDVRTVRCGSTHRPSRHIRGR